MKVYLSAILLSIVNTNAIKWSQVKCSMDADEGIKEGQVEDIGRFPWLGLVMHKFYLGGQRRTTMTGGVLIHPHYAVAPAEDIIKIQPELLLNSTTFVLYKSKEKRYIFHVIDYTIHPEYMAGTTHATLALLELRTSGETGLGAKAPILPVCLPLQGIGTYEDMHVVKFSDVGGDLHKSLYNMKYVADSSCEYFYKKAELDLKTKSPPDPICAVTITKQDPCVWESGYVLISRQNWGYWKLLGFGVRGPGCGAPSKFIDIVRFMTWIDVMLSPKRPDELWGKRLLYVRRQSQTELILYPADMRVPVNIGQCEKKERGNVIFRDSSEVMATKNFAQGFYMLSVHQAAEFSCARVFLESTSRTNAVIWLEHNCINDMTGLRTLGKFTNQRLECFIYYKTSAYLEFRFHFSFRAVIEVTLFGKVDQNKKFPDPFMVTEFTLPWLPTARYIRKSYFVAYQQYWWNP